MMKVGSVGTHLHMVCAAPNEPSGMAIAAEVNAAQDGTFSVDIQDVARHGIHSFQWWSDDRAARVAMLRARVKSGTYKVESMTIAECILSAEIHPA